MGQKSLVLSVIKHIAALVDHIPRGASTIEDPLRVLTIGLVATSISFQAIQSESVSGG